MDNATHSRGFALAAVFVLGTLVLGFTARAQEAGEAAPPTETTQVIDEAPPGLQGIWLLVAHGHLRERIVRTSAEFYEVSGEAQALRFHRLQRQLPEAMRNALDRRQNGPEGWSPSPEELEELRRSVYRLPKDEAGRFLTHEFKVVQPSSYETELLRWVNLPDWEWPEYSEFALKIHHGYRPQPHEEGVSQLIRETAVYVVSRSEPTLLAGDHRRVVLALGYVPIPISMNGPFVMYRLRGPGEGPSWVDRFAEAWSEFAQGWW